MTCTFQVFEPVAKKEQKIKTSSSSGSSKLRTNTIR
jgi:hypothetical protein